jgi:hypothetical protein
MEHTLIAFSFIPAFLTDFLAVKYLWNVIENELNSLGHWHS